MAKGDETGPEADDEGSELDSTLERTVREGEQRLNRTWPGLVATGLVAGIDVGFGVFAFFLVKEGTGSDLLAALAFGIGFIALTLGNSELFTEDFLVPIATLAAHRTTPMRVARLWGVTLVANLMGGWLVMALMMSGFPNLRHTAVEAGSHYHDLGIGWRSFSAAILGGAVLTLMTWMERSTPSVPAKLVAALSVAFVLAAAPLHHVVVDSQVLFAGLQSGAPFGYLDWLALAAWYTLGNMVGGIVLVTGLRLTQLGHTRVDQVGESRQAADDEHVREEQSVDEGTTE
jgi:formate/nitrite transporter FocA (FNT family)